MDAMLRIALFEDRASSQFSPLSLLRPVFELRCGHFSVRERVLAAHPHVEWAACLRPWLRETYALKHPAAHANDETWLREGPTLFINGRWLGDPRSLSGIDDTSVGVIDDQIVWLVVDPDEAALIDPADAEEGLARIAASRRPEPAEGVLLRYPWDLIHHNAEQLARDYHLRSRGQSQAGLGPQIALQGDPANIHIDPSAVVDPFVVIDARHGPVWIEAEARLLPFTRIEGPAYIGRGTQVFRAHVREGTSIGPVCRIGGEIEESIFHGYGNKYHDGFLGHSYVCPWVNLGALSTNSDLKNDYSAVKVPLMGESIDTGSTKVGCFIGDHTKTALGSLFNTGSSIGLMTMILPGGELLPKHVPSFTRVWHGRIEELPQGIEPSLAIARTAMGRRKLELAPAMERLLREVYRQTAGERTAAIQRSTSRARQETATPHRM
jgi:UDP-N-acetylglucosamine diphosphorylase/glucosamine-1-phosphate N-acetyltransferase